MARSASKVQRRNLLQRAVTLFVFPFKLLKRVVVRRPLARWHYHMFVSNFHRIREIRVPRINSWGPAWDIRGVLANCQPMRFGWAFSKPRTSREKRHDLLRDFYGISDGVQSQQPRGLRLLPEPDPVDQRRNSGQTSQARSLGEEVRLRRAASAQSFKQRQRLLAELDRVPHLSRLPEEGPRVRADQEASSSLLPSTRSEEGAKTGE